MTSVVNEVYKKLVNTKECMPLFFISYENKHIKDVDMGYSTLGNKFNSLTEKQDIKDYNNKIGVGSLFDGFYTAFSSYTGNSYHYNQVLTKITPTRYGYIVEGDDPHSFEFQTKFIQKMFGFADLTEEDKKYMKRIYNKLDDIMFNLWQFNLFFTEQSEVELGYFADMCPDLYNRMNSFNDYKSDTEKHFSKLKFTQSKTEEDLATKFLIEKRLVTLYDIIPLSNPFMSTAFNKSRDLMNIISNKRQLEFRAMAGKRLKSNDNFIDLYRYQVALALYFCPFLLPRELSLAIPMSFRNEGLVDNDNIFTNKLKFDEMKLTDEVMMGMDSFSQFNKEHSLYPVVNFEVYGKKSDISDINKVKGLHGKVEYNQNEKKFFALDRKSTTVDHESEAGLYFDFHVNEKWNRMAGPLAGPQIFNTYIEEGKPQLYKSDNANIHNTTKIVYGHKTVLDRAIKLVSDNFLF